MNFINSFRESFVFPIVSAIIIAVFAACDSDGDEVSFNEPSYRDKEYTGEMLTVYLNEEVISDVTSVTLKSTKKDTNAIYGDDGEFVGSNPTYYSTITIKGFPKSKSKVTLETISDLDGFSGSAEIEGVQYDYVGEFTGGPLLHTDNKGLILSFITK